MAAAPASITEILGVVGAAHDGEEVEWRSGRCGRTTCGQEKSDADQECNTHT